MRSERLRKYHRDYYKRRRKADPLYCESNRLKHLYGLTLLAYSQMVVEQSGKCALCGIKPKGRLVVDHDHSCCSGRRSCGKCIRGLVCKACNLGLGLLGDDADGLRRALRYLEKK